MDPLTKWVVKVVVVSAVAGVVSSYLLIKTIKYVKGQK